MKTAIIIFCIGLLIMIGFIACCLVLNPNDEELEEMVLEETEENKK